MFCVDCGKETEKHPSLQCDQCRNEPQERYCQNCGESLGVALPQQALCSKCQDVLGREIDERVADGEEKEGLVITARMQWHYCPECGRKKMTHSPMLCYACASQKRKVFCTSCGKSILYANLNQPGWHLCLDCLRGRVDCLCVEIQQKTVGQIVAKICGWERGQHA